MAEAIRPRCWRMTWGLSRSADPFWTSSATTSSRRFHTKTLISFVVRMNREAIRTPKRSVSNPEFHHKRG